jgi:hypothetical protein
MFSAIDVDRQLDLLHANSYRDIFVVGSGLVLTVS